jgi:hypothetical protein
MKKIAVILVMLVAGLASAQLLKTNLNVTVRDETGNIVPMARVVLFETKDDYDKEQQPAAQTVTDNKGVAKFKDLKPISYFILVRKDDKDNSGGGEQTGKLESSRINKVTIIIQ